MELIENRHGDIHVFRVSGRLDSMTAPRFDEALMKIIGDGTSKLVIDCEDLEYISSAGLRVLNKVTKRLQPKSGKIVLCLMVDYIREVFEIAGFDTFLPIVATLDDALSQF